MQQLFRQEAIDAQREKLLGAVSVARPVPWWVFTALAVSFAVALLLFVFLGESTRRERVDGFLALDTGVARLLAPEAGVLAELMVREGEEVAEGAAVARLSLERTTSAGASSSELVQRELQGRLSTLQSETEQARLLAEQQAAQLRVRIANLQRELAQFDTELKLQNTRVAAARTDFDRAQDLRKEGFYSDSKLSEMRNAVLDQQVRLQSLIREKAATERELSAAQAELPTIETRARQAADQLARARSEVQQGIVQEQARREIMIRAPFAGVVTNIAPARGDSLAADAPIATVVPKGSGLHAQLLVPTRAIGFVQPGNEVVLRYEAFPFQRFGHYRGTVEAISRTVWSPGERLGPLAAKEPVYRIDVKLDQQSVVANGQAFALRPGMLVNADLLLEKRTVFEWVFEPVLELRERLRS
jgi:membrane fusion protein